MVKKNVVAGSGFQSRTVNGVVGVGAANKSTGDELQVPSNSVYNSTCFFFTFFYIAHASNIYIWMKIQKSIFPIVTKPTPSVVVLTVTGTRSKKTQ